MLVVKTKGFGRAKTTLMALRKNQLTKAEERGLLKGMLYLEKYIKSNFTGGSLNKKRSSMASKKRGRGSGSRSQLRMKRSKSKRPRSLPMQPPAVQSGKLRGSIKGMITHGKDGSVVGLIGAIRTTLSRNYDIYLELGTGKRGSEKRGTINEKWLPDGFISKLKYNTRVLGMYRRPYLQPAVERNERLILRYVREEIRKATNRKI